MAASPLTAHEQLTGLVLCGGKGRRMSPDGTGIDKGFVRLRGHALIEHVLARLRPQVACVLLNAPSSPRWASLAEPVVPDQLPGSLGPLAGLHAGLVAARTDWVLSVPCDAPLLPTDLAARLIERQARSMAPCVSVRCRDRKHPVFALVSVTLLSALEIFIDRGGRKVDDWFTEIGGAWCDFPDPLAFTNLNTPTDLETLERQ